MLNDKGKNTYFVFLNVTIILLGILLFLYTGYKDNKNLEEVLNENLTIMDTRIIIAENLIDLTGRIAQRYIYDENIESYIDLDRNKFLLDLLEYNEEGDFFHIDKLAESVEDTHNYSAISGSGNLDFLNDPSNIKTKEIYMAVLLNDVFRYVNEKVDNSEWVVYISNNRFTSARQVSGELYTSDKYVFDDVLLEREYVTGGSLENNPNRQLYWNSPYLDIFGKDIFITLSYPIDYNNEHIGSICVDFKYENLSNYIIGKDNMYVINNKGEILATNDDDIKIAGEVPNLNIIQDNFTIEKVLDKYTEDVRIFKNKKVVANKFEYGPFIIVGVKELISEEQKLQLSIFFITLLSINIAYYIQKSNRAKIRKRLKQLKYLADSDQLTGLYNRHGLNEILEQKVLKNEVIGSNLIIIDIDHFKNVNDTYGHDVGDEVLKKMADIIKNSTRESDYVARFGGEEFVVLTNECEIEQAVLFAEKIRKNVENETFHRVGKITISIGVANSENNNILEDCFKDADKCLYTAKESGRNQVCYYKDGETKQFNTK